MARFVLKNCFVEVNSSNISDHCSSAEIDLSKDDIDITNFGGNGREHAWGLQDNSIVLNLQQDFDASSIDSIFYPLWDLEEEFQVTIRPTADVIGTDNPEYTATCIVQEYKPLSGDVGSLSEVSITCVVQRDTFARATS